MGPRRSSIAACMGERDMFLLFGFKCEGGFVGEVPIANGAECGVDIIPIIIYGLPASLREATLFFFKKAAEIGFRRVGCLGILCWRKDSRQVLCQRWKELFLCDVWNGVGEEAFGLSFCISSHGEVSDAIWCSANGLNGIAVCLDDDEHREFVPKIVCLHRVESC